VGENDTFTKYYKLLDEIVCRIQVLHVLRDCKEEGKIEAIQQFNNCNN
jgi:hypothetical protein